MKFGRRRIALVWLIPTLLLGIDLGLRIGEFRGRPVSAQNPVRNSVAPNAAAAGSGASTVAAPAVDPELVKAQTVTCVVQVAGKVKARLEVDPQIGEDDLQAAALADQAIVAALGGVEPRRVIVRAPKLVNIVPG